MSDRPDDPTPEKGWKPAFLAELQESANVSEAARAAGINRQYAYEARGADPAFAAGWDAALEVATDALEGEARRRALAGVEEPIYFKGKECGRIRRYSDTLTIFLLKAHRPERFRDRVTTEHTGGVDVRVIYVDDAGDPPSEAASGPADGPAE